MSNYILDDKELAFIPIAFKEMVKEEVRMAELKDSGERKIFETGAAREIFEGKGRCDLLPLDTIVYILEPGSIETRRILISIDEFLKTGAVERLREAIYAFCDQRDWSPTTMLIELSIHYEDGARKYADNNWKKGLPVHCFIDSGLRHYFKWLRGDEDEPHDRAFVWNLVGAIWTMENKPEFNDISGY
jgi:hypothetical protein